MYECFALVCVVPICILQLKISFTVVRRLAEKAVLSTQFLNEIVFRKTTEDRPVMPVQSQPAPVLARLLGKKVKTISHLD